MVAGGVGSTLGGFVDGRHLDPVAKAPIAVVADPPSLDQPAEPYTSEATVDLVVTVPAALDGDRATIASRST